MYMYISPKLDGLRGKMCRFVISSEDLHPKATNHRSWGFSSCAALDQPWVHESHGSVKDSGGIGGVSSQRCSQRGYSKGWVILVSLYWFLWMKERASSPPINRFCRSFAKEICPCSFKIGDVRLIPSPAKNRTPVPCVDLFIVVASVKFGQVRSQPRSWRDATWTVLVGRNCC